ncbi:methyltransferase domain-containing protein [Candidatus Peregrinibacteria bacterium]|nr:methyltransferase domain-containing protein [Candidatus Peregrinibacteria bacterium]
MKLTPRTHVLHGNINVRMRESVLTLLDVQPGETVLDCGCGLGYFLLKLKESGAKLHGIDVSPESVAFVREHITQDAHVGSAEQIPYPDNTFDKIMFCEVIEHVEDDAKVLREIRRVLKPGGRVVITTPSLKGFRAHSKLKQLGHHHGGEFHFRDGYMPEDLSKKLSDNGYRVLEVKQAIFLLSELIMELTKVVFLARRKRFEAQSELLDAAKTFPYKALRAALAVLIPLCRVEDAVMIPLWKRGHALIISAEKIG